MTEMTAKWHVLDHSFNSALVPKFTTLNDIEELITSLLCDIITMVLLKISGLRSYSVH